MKIAGQLIYGWFDEKKGEYRLSRYPADAPVRPSIPLASKEEAMEVAKRKRMTIYWWPPLPGAAR